MTRFALPSIRKEGSKQCKLQHTSSPEYQIAEFPWFKITVDPKTDNPTEISWYLNGKLTESAPVTCSLEIAKRIAQEVVDQKIAEDAAWANAESRHNSDIWKKP